MTIIVIGHIRQQNYPRGICCQIHSHSKIFPIVNGEKTKSCTTEPLHVNQNIPNRSLNTFVFTIDISRIFIWLQELLMFIYHRSNRMPFCGRINLLMRTIYQIRPILFGCIMKQLYCILCNCIISIQEKKILCFRFRYQMVSGFANTHILCMSD